MMLSMLSVVKATALALFIMVKQFPRSLEPICHPPDGRCRKHGRSLVRRIRSMKGKPLVRTPALSKLSAGSSPSRSQSVPNSMPVMRCDGWCGFVQRQTGRIPEYGLTFFTTETRLGYAGRMFTESCKLDLRPRLLGLPCPCTNCWRR